MVAVPPEAGRGEVSGGRKCIDMQSKYFIVTKTTVIWR